MRGGFLPVLLAVLMACLTCKMRQQQFRIRWLTCAMVTSRMSTQVSTELAADCALFAYGTLAKRASLPFFRSCLMFLSYLTPWICTFYARNIHFLATHTAPSVSRLLQVPTCCS